MSAPQVSSPPLVSYEEAVGSAEPPAPAASAAPAAPAAAPELPPDYTVVDEKATSFTIYGTFIYTSSGPAYQLSSLLDACINRLRIRRLRAEEISRLQAGATRIAFDTTGILYEAHDPPFLSNEYYIEGKQRSCLPGVLQMRFGLKRWHVRHIAQQQTPAHDLMTCGKPGSFRHRIKQRTNEMEPSEWKDSDGTVVATEVLKLESGGKCPTIELREGLDETCRELILALWVTRLWASFGAGSRAMYLE